MKYRILRNHNFR